MTSFCRFSKARRSSGVDGTFTERWKNVFDFRQDPASFLNEGRMKTYVGDQPVTFKGPAVRVALNDPGPCPRYGS